MKFLDRLVAPRATPATAPTRSGSGAGPRAATLNAPVGFTPAPQPARAFRPKKGQSVAVVPVFNPAGIVEGAGVEQDQIHHARLDFNAAAIGIPVVNGTMGGRPIRRAWFDAPPAQTFPSRIRAKDVVPPRDLNANIATPHLPGRVDPSVWDGEPGAASPVRQGIS